MNAPPVQLQLAARHLAVQWAEGQHLLPASYLRQHCQCNHCRRQDVAQARPHIHKTVTLTDITPVGSYGVQLHFSDGHHRGIYPWAYLWQLAAGCRCEEPSTDTPVVQSGGTSMQDQPMCIQAV